MKALVALLALAATGAADTQQAVRFIACPIYRDTDAGRKSGCWLADDPASGIRYDVTSAPTKPDWNHAVLVEGRPAPEAGDPCGGIVLEPARVSVLEESCTRFMLSAEGHAGRKFALPERNVRPLYEARTPPPRPFAPRDVTIPFDFGSDFVSYQLADYYLDQAINYALDVQPARITVTGFAATEKQSISGRTLAEDPGLAHRRAELVAHALVLRGVAPQAIQVATGKDSSSADPAFDGLAAPSHRRVEVRIEPLAP